MKNEKILITGGGGFIGSHLVEGCLKQGYQVKVLVHYNSRNSLGWLEDSFIKKDIEVISGDVRDYDMVFKAAKGVEGVFHLAALIGIPYSYISPLAYIKTNIEGTYNVLEAARQLEIKNLLITSTSETYGTAQYIPINEKHPAVGQSPYAATKIAADEIALSYWRSFNTPVKIVRPFNTYGPRQSARAIVPSIITQVIQGKAQINLGSTTPTRDFTFVKDTVQGFIEIYKSDELFGQATNIGMGKEISIQELTNLIADIMHVKIDIINEKQRMRPVNSEVERLFCDNSKLCTHTDWKPKYSLKQGLTDTIEWISRNQHHFKQDAYNI